jgi:DNA modification methylase
MLGKTTASISQDVKIANAIEKFPELKLDLVTSKITALRMLHRLRAGLENKVLTRNLPASELLSSYVLGDFFLQALPAESYTIIECDPPYGIDLVSQRDTKYAGALSSEYVEQSASDYPDFIKRLAVRLYELAAPRCWLIFWFGPEWTSLVYDCLSRAGWYVCSVPPIWKKGNTLGQSLSPDSNLSNAYECFYYARKGNPKLAKFGRSNIFDFTPVSGRHRIHPTERPPALIKEILETFCMSPSDMNLLCPFAGSGNTLAVAHSLGMRSIGFDLSKEFYESFVGRYLHSNLTPNEVGEEAV